MFKQPRLYSFCVGTYIRYTNATQRCDKSITYFCNRCGMFILRRILWSREEYAPVGQVLGTKARMTGQLMFVCPKLVCKQCRAKDEFCTYLC